MIGSFHSLFGKSLLRKSLIVLAVAVLAGCVTVKMPQYLSDVNPYKKQFYASYDNTLDATLKALEALGWTIASKANPGVFEKGPESSGEANREILIFTEVRQKPLFLASKYTNVNAIVREGADKTEVEIRYFAVLSTAIKNFENYRNEAAAEKIFQAISKQLNQP